MRCAEKLTAVMSDIGVNSQLFHFVNKRYVVTTEKTVVNIVKQDMISGLFDVFDLGVAWLESYLA